eukprot:gene399-biopygen295
MRFAAHFGAPPEEGASSSAAQVGVGVQGGAETCVHTMQALLGAVPSWCALHLDCKNAFNTIHRKSLYRAVFEDFPKLHGMTESCFRREAKLGWRGADGEFHWVRSAEAFREMVDADGDPMPGAEVPLQAMLAGDSGQPLPALRGGKCFEPAAHSVGRTWVDLGPTTTTSARGMVGLVGTRVEAYDDVRCGSSGVSRWLDPSNCVGYLPR